MQQPLSRSWRQILLRLTGVNPYVDSDAEIRNHSDQHAVLVFEMAQDHLDFLLRPGFHLRSCSARASAWWPSKFWPIIMSGMRRGWVTFERTAKHERIGGSNCHAGGARFQPNQQAVHPRIHRQNAIEPIRTAAE
jgi:hypothetical protein